MGGRYAAELSLSSVPHLLKLADDSYQHYKSSDELYGIKLQARLRVASTYTMRGKIKRLDVTLFRRRHKPMSPEH